MATDSVSALPLTARSPRWLAMEDSSSRNTNARPIIYGARYSVSLHRGKGANRFYAVLINVGVLKSLYVLLNRRRISTFDEAGDAEAYVFFGIRCIFWGHKFHLRLHFNHFNTMQYRWLRFINLSHTRTDSNRGLMSILDDLSSPAGAVARNSSCPEP